MVCLYGPNHSKFEHWGGGGTLSSAHCTKIIQLDQHFTKSTLEHLFARKLATMQGRK